MESSAFFSFFFFLGSTKDITETFFTEDLFAPGWKETVAQVHLIREMTVMMPVKKVSGMRIDWAVQLGGGQRPKEHNLTVVGDLKSIRAFLTIPFITQSLRNSIQA